jgi:2-isopropylmalate synthase
MHVAGVSAQTQLYEHIEPAVVGNERELVVSELAGRASMQEKAAELGLDLDGTTVKRVLERVKRLEHEGYQFEAADGSLELLLRRESGDYEPLFELDSWRVVVESDAEGEATTQATIKVRVGGRSYERTASGNGPVNALDAALRSAMVEVHPHLSEIDLVNYKVRILDAAKGTGAVTRVLIDASDGNRVWGAIGVSENVIVASWQALVDSLECGMLPSHVK